MNNTIYSIMEEKEIEHISFGGISLDQVENKEIILYYLDHSTCVVCLKIVRNPVECEKCESLFCKDCYESLKILKIKEDCNTEPVKANKFLREVLSKLRVTCYFCKKHNIEYDNFTKHLHDCSSSSSEHVFRDEYIKKIKEKEENIASLEEDLILASKSHGINEKYFFNNLTDKEIREKVLTFNLTPGEKLDLYSATLEGNLIKFKQLINEKHYPIFEEVSAKGYFWTPLHYAMHYGKFDIIQFILKYSEKIDMLNYIIRSKSDDNRCPLLCLIRSNSIKINEKNDLLEKIIVSFPKIYISQAVINECKARKISENILKKLIIMSDSYNKNTLSSFLPKISDFDPKLTDIQIREKLLTVSLNSEQKMALYNATIEGNINKLKSLIIENKYPIFEEVSAKGYFWTVLHYAMHYGKLDVILFLLKLTETKNVLNLSIRLKSNDNRCPLVCLLRSNSLNINLKIDILDKILSQFPSIYISADVIKEAKLKGVEKVLQKHNKM